MCSCDESKDQRRRTLIGDLLGLVKEGRPLGVIVREVLLSIFKLDKSQFDAI